MPAGSQGRKRHPPKLLPASAVSGPAAGTHPVNPFISLERAERPSLGFKARRCVNTKGTDTKASEASRRPGKAIVAILAVWGILRLHRSTSWGQTPFQATISMISRRRKIWICAGLPSHILGFCTVSTVLAAPMGESPGSGQPVRGCRRRCSACAQ